ncbi:MAG: hypothetical protein E6J15_11185 [Chloroflexi bacterium]|nr:MAG: hypothetical protein E6J15_11185 [Chloroflexota bacterium]
MSVKHTIALGLALFLSLSILAGVAEAGKGGHRNAAGSGSGSLSLVLLNSTDGLAHYGQNVTFTVSSTVSQPWVNLTCYQNGDWVTNQYVGFYAGYPWSQVFPLATWKWTGGAADCTARLFDGLTNATLGSMSFHAYE